MTLCGWKIFSKNKQKIKRNQIIKNDVISPTSSSSSSPIVPSTTKSLIQQKQHKNIISASSSSTAAAAVTTSISSSQPDIPLSSSHLVPLLSQQVEHDDDDDDNNKNIQNKLTKEIKLESISPNVPPPPPSSQSPIPPSSPKQTEKLLPLFAASPSSLSLSPAPPQTTISNSNSTNKKQLSSKQNIIKKFTSRTVEDFILFDKKNKKINKWKFRQKGKSKSDDEDEERGRNRSHRDGNNADDDDDDDNGNPRNKCALKPGHSLIDWIRLGTSGCDLSGTKGVIKPVSSSEVKLHCKKDDAWLIIRGKVYNVTHYMDFHPGGADELMKGVGKDATQMFDEIHAWVNYEQLLSKCYIGPLQNIVKVDLEFQQRQQKPPSRMHHQKTLSANGGSGVGIIDITGSSGGGGGGDDGKTFSLIPSSNSAKTSPTKNYDLNNLTDSTTKIKPRFDWIQKTSDLTLIFYTKSFCNPGLIITCNDNYNDNDENNLNYEIKIIIERIIHQFNIKLLNNVKWPPKFIKQNNETGKIEINLLKSKLELWKNYGLIEYKNYDCINDDFNIEYKLIEKYQITHDSYAICLKSCSKIIMITPIGYHVSVTALVNDKYVTRSYTPVPVKYMPTTTTQTTKNCPNNIILSFLIKSYSTGLLAKYITSLSVNNEMSLSSSPTSSITSSSPTKNDDNNLLILSQPKGSFDLKKLLNHSRIGLLAAGSGITPMLSVLDHLLLRITNRIESIQLLLFNKSENDIWCREKLDLIASSDNRLIIRHILSEPNEEWKGEIGRISKDLISSLNFTYCCVCGPTPFNDLCLEILKDIGYQSTDLHFFQG